MIFTKNTTLLLIMVACLTSCHYYPKDVQEALRLSGTNKKELESVIDHYSNSPQDSLKLKAAYFLIGNMPGKYYYTGDLLNHYYTFVGNIENKHFLDSIRQVYGPFRTDQLEVKYDVRELKASFIIDNIDMAFKVWHDQPWGKDINFKQFCDYILPYRIGNEIPNYNRAEIYKRYNKVLDSTVKSKGDALNACFSVNDVLMKEKWHFSTKAGFLPFFSATKLLSQKSGNCRDMACKTIFIMRALGIPVSYETVPNWANRNGAHLWNVVLDKNGKNRTFMGMENNKSREFSSDVGYTFPKVFLNTFSQQDYSSELRQDNKDDVPVFFKNNLLKDVTDENIGCKDIILQLKEPKDSNSKYAYLCIFDNANWTPVHWGKISQNQVTFKKMMTGITYLPAYFKNGILRPTKYPFTLMKNGHIKYLAPIKSDRKVLTLDRKYPAFMNNVFPEHMKGGKFQASNDRDFLNAVTFYTIPYPKVEMKWYDVSANLNDQYKYYRYLSPEDGWGNIAELEFYSKNNRVTGEIFGTQGSYENRGDFTFASAMDGDELTFFDCNKAANVWVGLKPDKAIKVDRVKFLPRNDGNAIFMGQEYELFYWENNQWVSLGIKIADGNNLIYKNVPGNALYLLRNNIKGREERIFTYENDKQIWW